MDLLGRIQRGDKGTRATRPNRSELIRSCTNVDITIIISRDPAEHGPTTDDMYRVLQLLLFLLSNRSFFLFLLFFTYFLPSFIPLMPPSFYKEPLLSQQSKRILTKKEFSLSRYIFHNVFVNPLQSFGLILHPE